MGEGDLNVGCLVENTKYQLSYKALGSRENHSPSKQQKQCLV